MAVAYPRGPLEQGAALQACVVAPCQALRVRGPARQEPEKGFHSLGIEAECGRKLPKKRSGLSAQRENAARVEVGEGCDGAGELQVVRDEAAALYCECEIVRCRIYPATEYGRGFETVECAVELDGIGLPGWVLGAATHGELAGIEFPAPARVVIAADSNREGQLNIRAARAAPSCSPRSRSSSVARRSRRRATLEDRL